MDFEIVDKTRKYFAGMTYKYNIYRSNREYISENKYDLKSSKYIDPLVERAINEFKSNGGIFGGFALTESSMRCLCYHLMSMNSDCYKVIEFGSGQSTIFFNKLIEYVNMELMSYEHDHDYSVTLINKMVTKNISILHRELRSVDDRCREKMFSEPDKAFSVWKSETLPVPKELYKNTRLHNCFYEIKEKDIEGRSADAVLLDGPHGDGRSICFPLLANVIRSGTLILIDDFHHYKFLDDMSRIFSYIEIEKRKYKYSNKGWVLLKIL